jgi:GDP-D-mannose dehydratase
MKKRVLVTGGAGFLGSHLCARLLEQECQVLCVDNYFTGTRNIEPLLGEPAFEVMRHDVTFPLYVEVDEIYNLACPASPIHYQHDPVQTTKTSVIGAINMLGLAKRLHARILLFCRWDTPRATGRESCSRCERCRWQPRSPVVSRLSADRSAPPRLRAARPSQKSHAPTRSAWGRSLAEHDRRCRRRGCCRR